MKRPQLTISGPVLDAPDVAELTRFYHELLGFGDRGTGRATAGASAGRWVVAAAPGGQEHQDRDPVRGALHAAGLARSPGDAGHADAPRYLGRGRAAGVEWAIACGATEAQNQLADRDRTRLRVMLDPAGHPFCLWS